MAYWDPGRQQQDDLHQGFRVCHRRLALAPASEFEVATSCSYFRVALGKAQEFSPCVVCSAPLLLGRSRHARAAGSCKAPPCRGSGNLGAPLPCKEGELGRSRRAEAVGICEAPIVQGEWEAGQTQCTPSQPREGSPRRPAHTFPNVGREALKVHPF